MNNASPFELESLESRFEMQAIDPVALVSSVSPMTSSIHGGCTVTN
jgi:hypothetical protein